MKLLSSIKQVALNNHWVEIDHQENIFMISFHKIVDDVSVRMNIYYSTMTVGTCLDHPKKGKTQLFRRNISLDELRKLFENPRKHTNKGYYKK